MRRGATYADRRGASKDADEAAVRPPNAGERQRLAQQDARDRDKAIGRLREELEMWTLTPAIVAAIVAEIERWEKGGEG